MIHTFVCHMTWTLSMQLSSNGQASVIVRVILMQWPCNHTSGYEQQPKCFVLLLQLVYFSLSL